MSENNTNVPKIRFPGFTGAWEQRKVIDIAPLQRGFDLPVSKMQEGKYPVVMSNGIGAYHSKYKAKAPGVVTGRSGTIGNLTFVETDYWPHNTTLWVTDFKGNDAKFIFYLYLKLNLKRFGTGSGVPTLNRNDVHDTRVSIPSIEEQKNIAHLFTNLDRLITLHQRKLDHLQDEKKSLLQKMFPKNGENFPELRFPGFTHAWEQRELKDVVDVCSGRDYKHLSDGDIPVYGTGGYMLSVSEALSYEEDAVGIGRKGTIDKPYLLRAPFWTVDTLFYAIPRKNYDLGFVHSVFQRINWKRKDESTGVPSLSKLTINSVKNLVPKYEEQQKIGTFFQTLDNTIALHQRKLDHCKKLKKAFLQQMFV